MMFETFYLTTITSSWDILDIIDGTMFKLGTKLSRFPDNYLAEYIKFLDWDFRAYKKKGKKVWSEHLELTQSYDFELVAAPDSFVHTEPTEIVRKYEKLKEYCDRVIIPVHGFFEEYKELELALPTASGFNDTVKNYWLWDIKDNITHILGGSPHSHFYYKKLCPKVLTADGTQVFRCAMYFGKIWQEGKWVKPQSELPNDQCLKVSLINVTKEVEKNG